MHDEVQPVDAVAGLVERRAALQRRQVYQVRGRPQRRLRQVSEQWMAAEQLGVQGVVQPVQRVDTQRQRPQRLER